VCVPQSPYRESNPDRPACVLILKEKQRGYKEISLLLLQLHKYNETLHEGHITKISLALHVIHLYI